MLEYYLISIGVALVCMIISAVASARVHAAYKKYGQMATESHMTGYDTAKKLLPQFHTEK